MPEQRAQRAAQIFRKHDEASVREMANVDEDDMKTYVSMARLHIANLENALAADRELEAETAAADESTATPDTTTRIADTQSCRPLARK
jgi:hypothetical protein